MGRFKELESKLSLTKRKAAFLLVENDLGEDFGMSEKKGMDEIAAACGVSRMQLWRYRQEPLFIEYKNMLADEMLKESRSTVYRQLMKMIMSPQSSVKAIDIYMKRFGLLTEKVVQADDGSSEERSEDRMRAELEELDELLEENEKE